jgi:phosphoribosylformylglycinamidine synthase PurS subunit
MKTHIYITLKHGVLDPQGEAAMGSLKHLGHTGVHSLRIGKFIELDIDASTAEEATQKAEAMCEALLANTVIESYRVEVAA